MTCHPVFLRARRQNAACQFAIRLQTLRANMCPFNLRRCQRRYAFAARADREYAARAKRAAVRHISQIWWCSGYAAHSFLWSVQRGERVQKPVGIGMPWLAIKFFPRGSLDNPTRV